MGLFYMLNIILCTCSAFKESIVFFFNRVRIRLSHIQVYQQFKLKRSIKGIVSFCCLSWLLFLEPLYKPLTFLPFEVNRFSCLTHGNRGISLPLAVGRCFIKCIFLKSYLFNICIDVKQGNKNRKTQDYITDNKIAFEVLSA